MTQPFINSAAAFQGRERQVVVPAGSDMMPDWDGDELRRAGLPVERLDGRTLVTGGTVYITDMTLPGMVWGVFVRSPHGRAQITWMDLTSAREVEGVLAVLSPSDVDHLAEAFRCPILTGTPLYAGETVALVIGSSEEAAREGRRQLDLHYDTTPAVTDLEGALEDWETFGSGDPQEYARGDVDAALQDADVVHTVTYRSAAETVSALEPGGAVAQWEHGAVTVWESTSSVSESREQIARILDLPISNVRVIAPAVGGSFGGKPAGSKSAVLAAFMARQLERPVRIVLDADEQETVGPYRPPTIQTLTIGAARDGTITAIRLDAVTTCGAYHLTADTGLADPAQMFYACPNVSTRIRTALTNRPPAGLLRGGDQVTGAWALEHHIDQLAGQLGLTPNDLRRRNAPTADPVTGLPYSSGNLRDLIDQAEDMLAHRSEPAAPTPGKNHTEEALAANPDRWKKGVGWAVGVWPAGGGFPCAARVGLAQGGAIQVAAGIQELGTGGATCLAQIAAEELQMDPQVIRVITGDSVLTPPGPPGDGGATIASLGPAVRAAARDLMRQLREHGAALLRMDAGQLGIADGRIFDLDDTANGVTFARLMKKLKLQNVSGEGVRGPNPTDVSIRAFGVHQAEVLVDTGTGRITITRYFALHDSGLIINPLTARTHVEGAVVEGIARACFRDVMMDSATGRRLDSQVRSAPLPGLEDLPPIDYAFTADIDPVANAVAARGLNGVSTLPVAAAVINAVYNATGVAVTELPLTRDRLIIEPPRPVPRSATQDIPDDTGPETTGETESSQSETQ